MVKEKMRRLDRRDNLDDVVDQMHKMFDQFQELADFRAELPVDVKEEDGNIVVKAELPGVEKDQINLKADDEGLEISAESSAEIQEENEKYLRKERSSREVRRRISWTKEIDPETVTASYEDGILTVEAEIVESEDRDIEIE